MFTFAHGSANIWFITKWWTRVATICYITTRRKPVAHVTTTATKGTWFCWLLLIIVPLYHTQKTAAAAAAGCLLTLVRGCWLDEPMFRKFGEKSAKHCQPLYQVAAASSAFVPAPFGMMNHQSWKKTLCSNLLQVSERCCSSPSNACTKMTDSSATSGCLVMASPRFIDVHSEWSTFPPKKVSIEEIQCSCCCRCRFILCCVKCK